MRRAILLRHTEAESDGPSGKDVDRRLTDQGREDAHRMGQWLQVAGYTPERIVASPAQRTVQTAEEVRRGAKVAIDTIQNDERILDNTVDALLEVLKDQEAGTTTLYVGHAPTFEKVLPELVQDLPEPRGGKYMPKGGLVIIDLPDHGEVRNLGTLVESQIPASITTT